MPPASAPIADVDRPAVVAGVSQRGYALLEIKSIDPTQRIIEGYATTPTPDRGGDVMDPAGAQFVLPMPFLWNHKLPIGEVFAADVRPEGIYIKAQVSTVAHDAPASLKERIDDAWHSLSATPPLARGLSIGWNEIESVRIKGTKFTRYLKWIWGETSAVVVPMNTEATILTVKSADLAATGRHLPGATGSSTVMRQPKAAPPMTITEQITQFENTRAAKAAARDGLMTKAADAGVTLDDAQTEEYDGLDLEIKSVDAHLVRLRDLEKSNVAAATKIAPTTDQKAASELRGGTVPIIQVKSMLPKGTAFTRMCQCIAVAKGDSYTAMERAREYKDSPEVELMVKAAIAPGTTTDATWAGPLAVAQPLVNEFLELLRPRTLVGRIPGLRHVPFNVSVPIQTGGGTYAWVGQGLAKPVTSAAFGTISVPFAKAAGIIVLTEELVKLSTPSAEATVREEMIAGIGQFLDQQFITVAVAAVANVNPASITNGAPTAAASGVTAAAAKTDLAAAVATFTAANIPLDGAVWIMSDSNAFGLSMAMNALGQPMFPGISMDGGTLFGRPVIISNAAAALVVLAHAPTILIADEGGVRIDVSREASVQMDSAPDSPAVATTVLVSLWQNNLVGLRAERMITWIRARTAAVRVITAAAYTGA